MLKRLCAAAVVAVLAVGVAVAADPIKVELKDFKFDPASELFGHDEGENRVFLYTNGKATAEVKIPEDGDYTVVIEASCTEANNEKAKVKVTVGDVVVQDKYELTTTDAKEYKFPAKLKKGDAKLTIEFLNDAYKENEFDRNLFVHKVAIEKK
jgi:hypothetical protein